MYLAAITWKANSSEAESIGSMLGVDELFKPRDIFDNIRPLRRNLNGMGMLYNTCITTAVQGRC